MRSTKITEKINWEVREWEPTEQIALNAGPQSWEVGLYLDSKNQGGNCSQCQPTKLQIYLLVQFLKKNDVPMMPQKNLS